MRSFRPQFRRQYRAVALLATLTLAGTGCAWIQRVSRPVAGTNNDVGTDRSAMSADGRYIAYAAATDETAPGVIDGIYRYDTAQNVRVLVSQSTGGLPANNSSGEPAIDSTGRYVAFSSDADNLVANDTNGATDVFVRDLATNTTTRVSVTAAGGELPDASTSPSISSDGRYVAFIANTDILPADSNADSDAYVHDRMTNANVLASIAGSVQPDFGISDVAISGNGLFVAFTTDTDLIASDQNISDDVYLRNLAAKTTSRISRPKNSLDDGGGDSPSLSSDGRYVAFVGGADIDGIADPYPGSDIFVRDTVANTVSRVSVSPSGGPISGFSLAPQLSSDGTRVTYMTSGNPTGTDTNGATLDAVVRDRVFNRTVLVSTDQWLTQFSNASSSPSISGNGRVAAFRSANQFVRDDPNSLADFYERAVDVPMPSALTPTTAARGATLTITISGTDFLPGSTVVTQPGVLSPISTTVNSDTMITATVQIDPSATVGLQTVYVKSPGTGAGPDSGAVGRCSDCLRVT
jgi:Tol biopolymer transport system component